VLLADQKVKQAEILELRSNLYEAVRPATVEVYDVCVPRSQIAGHVGLVHALAQRLGASMPSFGHAADGNVHSHFLKSILRDGLFGPELPNWRSQRDEATAALYADVAERGGVISGEHGIGLVKRAYLSKNLGPVPMAAMRAIKRALDPQGILNPGKIFET